MFRKLLYTFLFLFVALIVAAVAIPYFFKDKIIDTIEQTASDNCNCEIELADADLSIFKSFPYLNVSLEEFSIKGIEEYQDLTLFSAQSLGLDFNIMDVINGVEPLVIRGIDFDHPTINIVIPKVGKPNYDISKGSSTESTSTQPISFDINSIEINDANISYVDNKGHIKAVINNADFDGSISAQSDVYTLTQQFNADNVLVKSGNVKYINNASLNTEGDVLVNLTDNKYEFFDLKVALNKLILGANGKFAMTDDKVNIDLDMKSGKVGLREMYSVIPVVYTKDFADYSFEGSSQLSLGVKGDYLFNGKEMPMIDLDMNIDKGQFSYPDLSYPIRNINTKLHVNSVGKRGDNWKVELPSLSLEVNDEKVDGSFYYSGVGTDGVVKGAFVSNVHLENFDPSMSGLVDADVKFEGKIDDIMDSKYKNVQASGTVNLDNVKTKYENLDILINSLNVQLTPQNLKAENINAKIGKSDFDGVFNLSDPLAYIIDGNKSDITYDFKGNTLNVDDLLNNSSGTTNAEATQSKEVVATESFEIPVGKVKGKLEYNSLVYDKKVYNDFQFDQELKNDKLVINTLDLSNKDLDIHTKGSLSNIEGYMNNTSALVGDISLRSKRLYVNDYLSSEPVEGTPVDSNMLVLIPDNMNLNVSADIDHLIYDTYDVKDIQSKVRIKDEKMAFNKMDLEIYGSKMQMSGFYSSVDHAKPVYDIDYKLKKLDYQVAMESMDLFAKYMPLLKNLKGDMNLDLKASGSMDKSGMPNLNDISASGFLQTLTAIFDDNALWQKVSDKLGVKSIDKLNLKDTKNWFEISNGNFAIKPFDFEFEGLKFDIAGKHGLNTDMAYTAKITIPSDKMNQNKLTANLQTEANKLLKYVEKIGLKSTEIESYEWLVDIGGQMSKPTLKYKFLGINGKEGSGNVIKDQIDSVVETVKDSVETRIEEEKEKIKEQIETKTEEVVDSVKTVIQDKVEEAVDTLTNKVKDEATEILKDKADEVIKDVLKDKTDGAVDDAVEKAKEKLKKWNPFGKK